MYALSLEFCEISRHKQISKAVSLLYCGVASYQLVAKNHYFCTQWIMHLTEAKNKGEEMNNETKKLLESKNLYNEENEHKNDKITIKFDKEKSRITLRLLEGQTLNLDNEGNLKVKSVDKNLASVESSMEFLFLPPSNTQVFSPQNNNTNEKSLSAPEIFHQNVEKREKIEKNEKNEISKREKIEKIENSSQPNVFRHSKSFLKSSSFDRTPIISSARRFSNASPLISRVNSPPTTKQTENNQHNNSEKKKPKILVKKKEDLSFVGLDNNNPFLTSSAPLVNSSPKRSNDSSQLKDNHDSVNKSCTIDSKNNSIEKTVSFKREVPVEKSIFLYLFFIFFYIYFF